MANGEVLFVRGGKQVGSGAEDCGSTTEDDVWDDTALVEAYDRAVNLAKEEVARRMGLETNALKKDSTHANKKNNRKKKNNSNKDWRVGSHCRAVYSEDGQIYEATIVSIQSNAGTCVIQYVGYNNNEVVPLKNLLPSAGDAARARQMAQASVEEQNDENGLKMEYSDGEGSKGPSSIKSASYSKIYPNKKDWPVQGGRMSGRAGPYPPQFSPTHMPPMGLPPMVVPPPPPPQLTSCFPDEDTEALSAMLLSWYMSGFHTGYYQGLQHYKKTQNSIRRNPSRKT
ncbi:survival motor neuron protein isoform X2 [Anabrus simplex]|uniref:survival motor neuron protein isoform X2 n=1 Tax=Anabrus simplex TaxID=316456 RepID=UPI0034DCC576